MRTANIIHLSDIHFDNSENINDLLDKLKADLLEMKEELEEFHLMIISGDCVDRGRVNLFGDFKKKLDKIIKDCGISKKKVIIAIGNHDANLESGYCKLIKKSISEGEHDKNAALEVVQEQFPAIYPDYNNFDRNYLVTQDGSDILDVVIKYKKKTPIMRIRFVILNSSWSTIIHNKYGELVIGDKQLEQIKEKANSCKKKCDYVILCMHHPLDWFKYEEREKINDLMAKLHVNFFIHGHIHISENKNISNIDETINTFCTGISYKKTGENSSTKSGMRYSIYQLNKDTRTMNVYIRSTNNKGKFVEDNILYSNVKNGFFTIPLENPNSCLMPFKTVDNISKSSIVLTKNNVEKILSKEQLLFKFYCAMASNIDSTYSCNRDAKFIDYKNKSNKPEDTDENELKFRFENEQFGLFCFDILLNLNALFFNGEHVRFLIRKYNPKTNSHEAYFADGVNSSDLSAIKNFKWKTGLIYQSFAKQAALLKSCNLKYFENGNSDIWVNSLTIAVGDLSIIKGNQQIPILALNVAIDSIEKEPCLEALALSSIYEKIGEVFKLYNNKVCNLDKLILLEDNVCAY